MANLVSGGMVDGAQCGDLSGSGDGDLADPARVRTRTTTGP